MTKLENDIAISVKSVSKNFALPHEKVNSVKSSVVQVFRKKDRTVEVQHALKDISFDIKKGEFFGILGRNGSGKSTLLKILAEIYQPTKGSIETAGKLVPFIELGVGFNPELTGRENVYLNGALLGFSRKEIDARYDEIVEFAELEDFMDQKLKNYSSGMQVRLAFSVATRAEADILLVDEVLAVGDADFQRKCYDYFKSLKKTGKTVVFVTHDMGAVREYCDRAVLITEGIIAHEGDAEKVSNEYLKLFNKKENSTQDKQMNVERWGNGNIVFEDIESNITADKLTLKLPIKNTTDRSYHEEIDVGVDFYVEGQLVGGTHYLYYHTKGMSLKPNESKDVIIEFVNSFGGHTYDIFLNLKTGGGTNICDHWENALQFTNVFQSDKYFRVIIRPDIFK